MSTKVPVKKSENRPEARSPNNPIGKGRPPGAKNKTTLFKEAMRDGFENLLEKEGKKVFLAVVEKAKAGDMTAAKLILDRIVPVADVQSSGGGDSGKVVINISGIQGSVEVMDSKDIEDAEYEEVEA